MKRRNFLARLGAGITLTTVETAAQKKSSELIKPRKLQPGAMVGLITPATPTTDPDRLAMADRALKFFGFKVKVGKNVGRRAGYFGSAPEERLDDLHAMFRDSDVDAVFALRGGYGAQHLLDRIDYDLIRRNPKVLLGYSDITALHLAINKHAGLVTFHGPNMLSEFTPYSQEHFRRALFESKPLGLLANPPETNQIRPKHPVRTIRPGTATAPIIGGNLTLISTLMGTPYEIDCRGKILLIEDIGEEPYRIDRMLTQLLLAGKFKDAIGIVVGECVDCGPSDFKPSLGSNFSLGEVLDAMLKPLTVPVFYGLTFGHTDDQLTLPLGVMATMDADKGTLEIKESAFAV
ncbi:MAG: LD-carboxypeptidase [Acidobacteria bacterium]|nr:LD-carboxypeptidase [Acidobacteriota bacterium]